MSEIFAIVLAAGRGKRMKSNSPKVAHMLLKKSLLQWTIDSLQEAQIKYIMTVISKTSVIEDILKNNYKEPSVRFCYQEQPLGTAHAVQCGLTALTASIDQEIEKNESKSELRIPKFPRPWDETNTILIAYGDTPCIKSQTYQTLLSFHQQESNAVTIAAFYAKDPTGYGRVILDESGDFLEICEEKDCSPEYKLVNLCHSGVMCANFDILETLLPQIQNKNQSSEFYLTDIIREAKILGHKVGFIASDHESEFSGVNTLEQLKSLEATLCAE